MPESKLTKSAKALLEYFQTFPAGEPITTAQKEIATATNLSRRTVQNALEQLEKAGEIRIVSNKVEGAQNLYFVNCAPPAIFVSKDFTPKANAVLKNYIPPRQEEENRPEIGTAGKKPEYIICLLDKVSRKTFEIKESGNYSIAVESRADGKSKREVTVYIDIDFSEIENNSSLRISKPLTSYDKRVYKVICSLWKAENKHISLAQIYRELERKTGIPNTKQAERIRESVEKMAKIIIEIDNSQEANVYNYPRFQIGRTYLLPSESITDRSVEMNGKILDYCLFLYREPPLLTYAEAHKQITAFTPEQAALPDGLSTTEDNLQLDDYLKFRIVRYKTYGTKILFKTLYEQCEIRTRYQRSRATVKIRKLLTHYKETSLIKNFREHTDGITFTI